MSLFEEAEETALITPGLALLVLTPEESRVLRESLPRTADPGRAETSTEGMRLKNRSVDGDAWRRGQVCAALLISFGSRGAPYVLGVARITALKRGNGASDRAVSTTGAEALRSPLPWAALQDRLVVDAQRELAALLERTVSPLATSLTSSLWEALRAVGGEEVLRLLQSKLNRDVVDTDARDRDRRDRATTSIRIFGLNPSIHTPDLASGDELPGLLRRKHPLWETQAIREDSRELLPDWQRSDAPDAWYRFDKGGRRLFLREIHVDRGEHELGGDLVYLRQSPDAMVLVQYKRAVMGEKVTSANCRVDARFREQLVRMVAAGRALNEPENRSPSRSIDYRLSSAVGYLKIIEDRPLVRAQGHVYRGYYFPAELMLSLLDESQDGRLAINLDEDRFIDSDTFIRLAAGGWIGTGLATTRHLLKRLQSDDLLPPNTDTTVAIDVPAGA